MGARIFISYRTSDGMDKATALARDLGARFGDEQVFLDKEDLRGGSAWRDEVQRTLGGKPALLLLLTPQLFGATDHSGALRIADPDDPVRREFGAAIEAGATIIPVLCDGVEAPPDAAELPAPFDRLGDYTWRRLRAYDWKNDLERLVGDLVALGVAPRASVAVAVARPRAARRAMLTALGLGLVAWLVVLGWNHLPLSGDRGPVALALPGTWIATVGADPPFALTLQQRDDEVVLTSVPVPIDASAGWDSYRESWLKLTGTELKSIVYRGRGTVRNDPGAPLVIDIGWTLYNGAADTRIDSGNLHAAAAPDGRSLDGRLWSNGAQADRRVVLRRPR